MLLGLSGGVDSSVAAFILKEQGLDVHGLFVRMTCTSQEKESLGCADKIAQFLKIPLVVVDWSKIFRKKVIDRFISTYLAGRTPNPCVMCNPQVKFQALIKESEKLGIPFVSTGHYSRIKQCASNQTFLLRARDPGKDQSYFLHQLDKQVISRLILPLGNFSRIEVEKMASRIGITDLVQQESQDVCFLKGDYRRFLRQMDSFKQVPGPIKTTRGTVKGQHHGLADYTIGQRKGIGIPDKSPYYVVALDPSKNTLVIGKDEELFKGHCMVEKINWLVEPKTSLLSNVSVKLRSRHKAVAARI
ncbi:MAG: tRNA 2-thiouridine(34) synthase MnmA, partial [Thermodesulfatator sp.]